MISGCRTHRSNGRLGLSIRALTLKATQSITAIATVAAFSFYSMAAMTDARAGDDTRRLISAHGQTIEAFAFG